MAMPKSFPQMARGVSTSSRHNFYPLEFPCLSHFGAPPGGAGCSLLPRQPRAMGRVPWQGAAPTPLLSAPARGGNLPRDGYSWLVRHTYAWAPGGWETALSAWRGKAPCVCPSPSPRPAYKEDLSPRAIAVALGPFLKELHADPWRWWWYLLHNQPLSRALLRNFPLLHGKVPIYECGVGTVHV